MCAPVHDPSCGCYGSCSCVVIRTVGDEIQMLESARQRMQTQIKMTEMRIEDLRKKI
jgi:hypothetical protein